MPNPPEGTGAALAYCESQEATTSLPCSFLLSFKYTVTTSGQQLSFRYFIKSYPGPGYSATCQPGQTTCTDLAWFTPATFDAPKDWQQLRNQQALAYVSTAQPSLSSYPTANNILLRPEASAPVPPPGYPNFPPFMSIPAGAREYATSTHSLDPWLGRTIYITFAIASNQGKLIFGVDDIKITCAA